MTMPSEHAEAEQAFKAQEARNQEAMDATIENSRSITAVNGGTLELTLAKAKLRLTFAAVAKVGATLVVAWSAWAWVHWA